MTHWQTMGSLVLPDPSPSCVLDEALEPGQSTCFPTQHSKTRDTYVQMQQ